MTGPDIHIRTFTGKELNLFHMTEDDICIEDIAHALACINRFNGHVKKPINVAQHSVYVSRVCLGGDDISEVCRKIRLQGLLHDGAEAYIGDVTKWLKGTVEMTPFRDLEDKIQELIYKKFNVPRRILPSVKQADRVMVRFEGMRGFGPNFRIDHEDYPPLTDVEINAVGPWGHWSWAESEKIFLFNFGMYYEF